jgi:UDP-N-acetylglucosamine--N-acetylmuramyl-(pentapeptide) pyrophosphoryl-undecaprenol N-acetylglucosamine transferase
LFATGGYASVPVAMAAWTLRVPVLLYLPDIEPGLAVRWIARFARRIAVTVEDSQAYFPARKVVVTGYPIRPELAQADCERARGALDLAPNGQVLLVTGGSRGARSINRAVTKNLEELLQVAQVIHLSGELDWPWVSAQAEKLPADLRARYRPYPYLHEMGMALAASDVCVSRAGASALGEYPYFRLPAILVPYPHAWRYQRVNAEWLASRGAALHLPDEQLERELVEAVRGLVRDGERRAAMRERLQALAKPDAATRLAVELHTLAQRGAGEEAP